MAEAVAGIYCRISLASEGDYTKTDDQELICRELAERKGWRVAEVYVDHAKSAWQPNRKRPAFDAMVSDIEAGKINAIIVYHGDRLLRTHEDLLRLINLARTRGVKLASPGGEKDLGNPDDQFVLEIEASVAKRESGNLSRRRKTQYERMRRGGRVNTGGTGGRRYAFQTDGVTVVEDEAQLLREAARQILRGQSTLSVAAWLNSQGAATVTGLPFDHASVRRLLTRARYAGLMPDGISPAVWPAVLDRADWEAVCAILEARRADHPNATNRARYLLSGIALCGVCGHPVVMLTGGQKEPAAYGCKRPGCRKIYRSQILLDAYVGQRVVERLNRADNPAGRVSDRPGVAAGFRALTEARADLAARVEDPAQPYVDLLIGRLKRLDERIAALREVTADVSRLRLVAAHRDITWEQWTGLPLTVRRSLVTALFSVEVLRASRRGPGSFATSDVRMITK